MTVTTHRTRPELLGIYLNDHFAAAKGGLDLARRLVKSHQGTEAQAELERVRDEIAEDREALRQFMRVLGVPVSRYKSAGTWLAEKVGRLKTNGRLVSRSPLSSVVELEAMFVGVHAKAAGWRALRAVAEHESRLDAAKLDELISRAAWQADTLEKLRLRAADEVLTAPRR